MLVRRTVPWATYILIAANIAAFAVEIALGADPMSPTPQQMIDAGGNLPRLTLGGEPWRLLSSMFLHFGPVHLGLNMLCLYRASIVERAYGRLAFAVIYLLAGLGGGIAMLIAMQGNVVGAGASGAVFGVYGAFGAVLVLRRELISADLRRQLTGWLGRFLVLNLIVGLASKTISVSAHVGGLIVGFAVGACLLVGNERDAMDRDAADTADAAAAGATSVVATSEALGRRMRRALLLGAIGLLATGVAVMVLPVKEDVTVAINRFYALEHAAAARYHDAAKRLDAHELTDPQFADIIERDVVAPYRALHLELLSKREIPRDWRLEVDRINDVVAGRIDCYETTVAMVRTDKPDVQAKLQELLDKQEATLKARIAALEAENERRR